MTIVAVVVVYGQPANRTPAYCSINALRETGHALRVVVWDNSPRAAPSDSQRLHDSDLYVSTPENLGLSVIYNRVRAEHLCEADFVLLLDQDSVLPPDFLDAWDNAVKAVPEVDLYLPLVRAHNRWVSPLSYRWGWGRYWKEPKLGRIEATGCMAINSGMIIRCGYFTHDFAGYDERLRFYGTDTQLMVSHAAKRRDVCVFNAVIDHDLSFFSSEGGAQAKKFREMRAGYRYIYENAPMLTRLAVGATMLLVSLRYAIRFRSIQYILPGT